MFGLWIARDGCWPEDEIRKAIEAQLIPFSGFVNEELPFDKWESREDFLRKAAAAVMLGWPVPQSGIAEYLCGKEAMPGNVLRKYVCLQLSLLPYLRKNSSVTPLEGCFLLGDDLLVAPLGEDGRMDAQLPDGIWTELSTGETFAGRMRCLRGLNAMPVLARENSVIPIGVNDRCTDADDADRVTLHWFQPQEVARCVLADGTEYRLYRNGEQFIGESDTDKAWHMIVRQDGNEILVK